MKNIYKFNSYLLPAILLVTALFSCTKKDAYLGFTPGTGAPTITGVHTVYKTVVDSSAITTSIVYNSSGVPTTTTSHNYNPHVVPSDSLVTSGGGGNQYRIAGTNLGSTTSVTFNGVAAYFNPALLSDNSIIVTVPTTASFNPTQAATLTVTTLHGTATFKFTILQPPPTITSFSPLAAASGSTITINGTVFDNATSVKFGTVAATIVSNTSTQLTVLVPAGVVQAFISVTTPGGTAISTQSFGFKYLIYLSGLTKGWGGNGGGYSGYSGTVINFNNTTNLGIGKTSISAGYTQQYGALQIGYDNNPNTTTSTLPPVSVSALGLNAVEFSVYGGAGSATGDQLQVAVNGQYKIVVKITAGAYTTFTIPLSTFGNPSTIYEFVLQTFQSSNETIYVDYVGFI